MRSTTALLLRGLISKLHPPSPATSQESKQLLRLLDTSFRARLDDLHPAPSESPTNSPRGPITLGNSRVAVSHLDSVLQHPILSTPTQRALAEQPSADELFQEAVRESKVTPGILEQCCRHYLYSTKVIPSNRQLGPKIASWLTSIPVETQWAILTDSKLIPLLLPVMYAESMEAVVWDWLSIVYARNRHLKMLTRASQYSLLEIEDTFISAMIRESIRRRSIGDAAHHFVKANEYRAASGRANVQLKNRVDGLEYAPLLTSWKRISSAVLFSREAHGVSTAAFDDLLSYAVPFTFQPVINRALLMLYHPKERSSATLYEELQDPIAKQSWSLWCNQASKSLRKSLGLAVLDAAELSLTHGRAEQSQFFLGLAQEQWPKLYKATHVTEPKENLLRAKEEVAMNLHLPANLSLG